MSLLGIDVGTSGCKATLLDVSGSVLGQAYQEYSLHAPYPGWLEIDPDIVWQSVRKVVHQACEGAKDQVQAISVSSFGESVVALDPNGSVIGNSLLYLDARGQDEADWLRQVVGDARVLAITGTNIQPMYSLCKIMWIKKHRPERYANTWKYLLFADFVLHRLGARPHTDYSLAARTMAFDIVGKHWSKELLQAAGIDPDKFGEPVQSGTLVGEMSTAAAEATGLFPGISLVAGGHDQPCAALGAGVINPGSAVDGLGTTECITPVFSRPILTSEFADKHFACVPHVIANKFVTYAFTFTSGSVVKWYMNTYGQEYERSCRLSGESAFFAMIDHALTKKAPSPVFVLPHFAGAATPYMNTDAKGAILGLTIGTDADDILKAVLEGITYEIMINTECLAQSGILINDLRVVGGLAKSKSFLQMKADMMGIRLTTLKYGEAGTVGVAILAGTAIGVFKTVEQATERLVKTDRVYEPDPVLHQRYQERFETYKKIYPSICQIGLI